MVIIPFNETATARRILEENRQDLAAVIVEPVLGSVGMVPAEPEFLDMLRDFTEDNGSLLIFDEVISFRVAPGGAQETYGVTPDLTSLGKIVGGGFPVGAFGGRKEIMDLYDPTRGPRVSHAGTFNANPVTMVAGATTMELLTPLRLPQSGRAYRVAKEGHPASLRGTGNAGPGHRSWARFLESTSRLPRSERTGTSPPRTRT